MAYGGPSTVPSEESLLEERSPYYAPYDYDEHSMVRGLDDPHATSSNVSREPFPDSRSLQSLELQPGHVSQRRRAAQPDSIPSSHGVPALLEAQISNAERFQAQSFVPGNNGERRFSFDIATSAGDTSQEFLPRAYPGESLGYRFTETWQQPQPPPGPFGESQESMATEAWRQRQAPRRYPTRKIKLVQGSVLSVDYPVPSAIRNSVEKEYMDPSGLSEASEEFTHMRCRTNICC
jgi:Chitin synthase N-terminal